ncbi:MAG: DUF2267 domain-containing protein [Candidatus Promineifilaceae bacterium]|nr:DUF2267 domain-containing protein [Candidatus Promineifilaceae bacterium]
MTQSNGFDSASYHAQIQKQGYLLSPKTAEKWSKAVLRTLSLNIDRRTKKALANSLPDELAADLTRTFWLLHFRDRNKSRAEFLEEVAKRSGNTDPGFAGNPTKAVFHELKALAGDKVSNDVSEALAPELSQLWEEA